MLWLLLLCVIWALYRRCVERFAVVLSGSTSGLYHKHFQQVAELGALSLARTYLFLSFHLTVDFLELF